MMNMNYLFIWNKHKIKYYDLDKDFTDKNKYMIDFEIKKENETSWIKEVRTGSNPNLIIIIVKTLSNQQDSSETIFTWDVENNIEFESYDVQNKYEILWDRRGYPYIA